MPNRPRRSPSRRQVVDDQPSYRGFRDPPRDLLVFGSNPHSMSLKNIDEEAQAVQDAYPIGADVRQCRNLTPESLQQELLSRPPRAFLFIGHANLELAGEKTLGFSDGKRKRQLVTVRPDVLASMLGAFSPVNGGPLELVVLNGCDCEDLGRAVHRSGVPHVVCWKTNVESQAAAIFSPAFFEAAIKHECDYGTAFKQAKVAVETKTKEVVIDGHTRSIPRFELKCPKLHPVAPGAAHLVTWAAGEPMLLGHAAVAASSPRGSPSARSASPSARSHSPSHAERVAEPETETSWRSWAVAPLLWLLTSAERLAKEDLARLFMTASPPQQLSALSLAPGDRIIASVTLGYTSTVSGEPPQPHTPPHPKPRPYSHLRLHPHPWPLAHPHIRAHRVPLICSRSSSS